ARVAGRVEAERRGRLWMAKRPERAHLAIDDQWTSVPRAVEEVAVDRRDGMRARGDVARALEPQPGVRVGHVRGLDDTQADPGPREVDLENGEMLRRVEQLFERSPAPRDADRGFFAAPAEVVEIDGRQPRKRQRRLRGRNEEQMQPQSHREQ